METNKPALLPSAFNTLAVTQFKIKEYIELGEGRQRFVHRK
jgi:hypothetical protein